MTKVSKEDAIEQLKNDAEGCLDNPLTYGEESYQVYEMTVLHI